MSKDDHKKQSGSQLSLHDVSLTLPCSYPIVETYPLMALMQLFMKRVSGLHKNVLIHPKNTQGRKYQIKFSLQVKPVWKLIEYGQSFCRIIFMGDIFSSAMVCSMIPESHRTGRQSLCPGLWSLNEVTWHRSLQNCQETWGMSQCPFGPLDLKLVSIVWLWTVAWPAFWVLWVSTHRNVAHRQWVKSVQIQGWKAGGEYSVVIVKHIMLLWWLAVISVLLGLLSNDHAKDAEAS